MRKTPPSKHESMPEILATLKRFPMANIADLARRYDVPDGTIRGAWRTARRDAEYEAKLGLENSSDSGKLQKNTARDASLSPSIKTEGFSFDVEGGSGLRIAVIGDMQVKPDIDLGYCERIGRYMADKRPDVLVCIGDFADMPSLSFWEEPGSKAYNLQNYKADILAVHQAMKAMMLPIRAAMAEHDWKPRLVMTMGNHEDRITRTLEKIPKLDGTIGLPDLEYERWGWKIYPFLQPVTIGGVAFCHYFCSGSMGRPINSARAILTKKHQSSVCGHLQGRDIAFGSRGDGKQIISIICGSTYEHDEKYLNHQTNNHWRGLYLLNNVREGEFEELAVSLEYLRRKYGQ